MCISKQLGQDVWPCSVTLAVPTSRTFFLLFWHFQTDYVPGHWSEDWRERRPLSTYQAIVCWTGSKPLSIWAVATSTNSNTEACEHTHTYKEHDERALGHWVHLPACQAFQVVLEALGRHGDPAKTNTIPWLTVQTNSREVFSSPLVDFILIFIHVFPTWGPWSPDSPFSPEGPGRPWR